MDVQDLIGLLGSSEIRKSVEQRVLWIWRLDVWSGTGRIWRKGFWSTFRGSRLEKSFGVLVRRSKSTDQALISLETWDHVLLRGLLAVRMTQSVKIADRKTSFRSLLSVALWKEFASAYYQEYPVGPVTPGHLKNETPDFQTLFPPDIFAEVIPTALTSRRGTSPRGQILIALALRNVELSRAEWMGISKLDSLVILQVHGSLKHSFEAPIVRAWGDRAIESDAFSKLRVLELADEDGIPFESLTNFSKIKSLQVILWSGRNVTPSSVTEIEKYGWKQLCEHRIEDYEGL
jgi:hypothetical protein